MLPYETIPTICVAVVTVFAIQGITIYAVVKAVVLGRALAEKREQPEAGGERDGRILSPGKW